MGLDSERLLQERRRALETANEALRQNQQRLQAELYAAERLQNIATLLITARETAELYDQILDAARAILHAAFASMRIFCRERGDGELRLLSHRGLSRSGWIRYSDIFRIFCRRLN